jgi:hypothetical protein
MSAPGSPSKSVRRPDLPSVTVSAGVLTGDAWVVFLIGGDELWGLGIPSQSPSWDGALFRYFNKLVDGRGYLVFEDVFQNRRQ